MFAFVFMGPHLTSCAKATAVLTVVKQFAIDLCVREHVHVLLYNGCITLLIFASDSLLVSLHCFSFYRVCVCVPALQLLNCSTSNKKVVLGHTH